MRFHGTVDEVGLPDKAFESLGEELISQRIWEMEEYLYEANGIPLGLSRDVMAVFARSAMYGNDNLEEVE